jgi:hypothetical protein
MAKTAAEIIAENEAEYTAGKQAEAEKTSANSGFVKGTEAFLGKALQTLSGGLFDHAEVARRNYLPGYARNDYTVDEIRKEAAKLYEDRSGLATAGDLLGTGLQFSGVGKGIGLAGAGLQMIPKVAGAGKAVQTAMNAPGILGMAGSSAITGGAIGAGKEAHRLVTTDDEFNPIQSVANIGREAGLAGIGGAGAGAIAGVLPKGVISTLQRTPVDPKTIGRVQSTADHPIVQALGKTAPEGKASVTEAIRLADEPTLAQLASKLSGLKQVAGKNNTGTLLADEAAGQTARMGKMSTIDKMTDRATRAETAAGKRTGKMEQDQMTPEAYWKIQDDPALRGLRDTLISEERAAAASGYQTRKQFPMSATAAKAAAVKDVPADAVSAVTRMKPRANAEELQGIQSALETQSPFFKALHDAEVTRGLGDRIAGGALGRGHATPPPTSAGLTSINLGTLLNPKAMVREVALAGRDALQNQARKGAAQRELTMSPEEFLKIIGRRTGTAKTLENILPASLLYGSNNL